MVLDWLNTPITLGGGGKESLEDLIARRRYAKAIEVLRAQLEGRISPTPQLRLQLADLLVLAGRGAEAVPILVGLADEFARDGFVAKAVAILKRVERIEPGRADVETRLVSLVRQQQREAAPGREPAFGIEEFEAGPELSAERPVAPAPPSAPEPVAPAQAEAPSSPTSTDATVEPPPPASDPGGVVGRLKGVFRRLWSPAEESAPEGQGEDVSAVADSAEAAPETAAPERPPETAATQPAGDAPPAATAATADGGPPQQAGEGEDAATSRIRGAFRRFLEALPTPEGQSPAASIEDRPAAQLPAPPDAATGPEPEPAAAEEAPSVISEDAITIEEEPPLSEEAFQDRVLDLIQDVLHRPPTPATDSAAQAAAATPEAGPQEPAAAVPEEAAGARLVAGPLFQHLSEPEMLAVMHRLRLVTCEPGDVVVTEGEPGQGLYIVTTGSVKVFVRNPEGRNFVVGRLGEGEFFGEISSMSGRPRSATVTAAGRCELLALDKESLDALAQAHPSVRQVLEDYYVRRASSPEAAAVRAVPLGDAAVHQRALEVLEAHFGESRWDARMRLRLADLLLKSGKPQDAVPVLVGLADELARQGLPERAIAILKKIERIQRRDVEEVNLAPLERPRAVAPGSATEAASAPALATPIEPPVPARQPLAAVPGGRRRPATTAYFGDWIVDVMRDTVRRRPGAPGTAAAPALTPELLRAYGRSLLASPLFADFSEDELLALIEGLRLVPAEPGDILLTEGELGVGVFILASGSARVFVRDARGHDLPLAELPEGAFFGEISTLSGRPRSASVVARTRCELLELDRPTLDGIARAHPRVREVLEEYSLARVEQADARRGDVSSPPVP